MYSDEQLKFRLFHKKIKIISSFLNKDITFIETGAHEGLTSSTCSLLCQHVYTAEIHKEHIKSCELRFANYPNVSFHAESSINMLEKIGLGKIEASPPYVFYLDAHDTNLAVEIQQKTLIRELKTIRDLFKKEDIRAILIDDSSGLSLVPEICTVQECCDLIMEIDPSYRISMVLKGGTYESASAYDVDVLVAYHPELVGYLV